MLAGGTGGSDFWLCAQAMHAVRIATPAFSVGKACQTDVRGLEIGEEFRPQTARPTDPSPDADQDNLIE
jgi:hypothetical protein